MKEKEKGKEGPRVQEGCDLFMIRAFHTVWKKKVAKQKS